MEAITTLLQTITKLISQIFNSKQSKSRPEVTPEKLIGKTKATNSRMMNMMESSVAMDVVIYWLERLLITALSAATIFFFIVRSNQSHWKKRGILHEKPKFFWGSMKGVGKTKHITTLIQDIYNKYNEKAPFVGVYCFLKPMVMITDLELVKQVLCLDTGYFIDRGLYWNERTEPLTANLFQADGEDWWSMRERTMSVFESDKIQTLLPTVRHVATNFRRSLNVKIEEEHQHIFNINELVDSFNVDVISEAAFGISSDTLLHPNTEFHLMSKQYKRGFTVFKTYMAINFPNLASILNYRSFDKAASKYFQKLVYHEIETREHRADRMSETSECFLDNFIKMKQNRGPLPGLTDSRVAAQSFSFLLIGLEAFNSTMTFCLVELALHQDIQNRVRTEIDTVLRKHHNHLNIESLIELQYLKQVLFETLRKHSPYPLLLRNTVKDYEIPNTVFMLKRDNRVIIPISAIHHDPKLFPDPERFDPDRFKPSAVDHRHNMAWIPFGIGPRNCIAWQFAQLQMLIGLMTLLRDYRFTFCADTCHPLQYDITRIITSPQSNVMLRIDRIT